MFEYFMPNLLLPCEENSLMYESLAFCVYAQKRRGARTHTPWGISESGFFALGSSGGIREGRLRRTRSEDAEMADRGMCATY